MASRLTRAAVRGPVCAPPKGLFAACPILGGLDGVVSLPRLLSTAASRGIEIDGVGRKMRGRGR